MMAVALPAFAWFDTHARGQDQSRLDVIRRIDIVHMTHTDIGFTDHPIVCRRQQMRYLDIAIDAVLATIDSPPDAQFFWTAETTLAVDDWWKAAGSDRRMDFLKAVGTGRLEIGAMAMNQTPSLNAAEWHTLIHWLPDSLWQKVGPRVAIQNDVNGFPRAGAIRLLDRGLEYLFMGINSHNGGPPMRTPSAFWWKMPDERRMFVWLGDHYAQGFYYFHPASWRRGPVPESTDTRYRPARPGDFFLDDEASVRASHQHLLGRLKTLQAAGYSYRSLIISVTNEWRMDNDPPFPPLARFVAAWNRLGLKPEIHLSTAADAMDRLKGEVGDEIPEYQGEWTDWWANGLASGPREVSASRKAKRLTDAALSPVWGSPGKRTLEAADEIYRDLCLFDEHTWGSVDSIGSPHSLETWGQYNEKSRTAYRPMALAKLILAQRSRSAIDSREEGFYVANPAKLPWSGWVTMPASALRGDFHSLEDPANGTRIPLTFEHGYSSFGRPSGPEQLTSENSAQTFPDHAPNQVVRFWVEDLNGETIQRLVPSEAIVQKPKIADGPVVTVDAHRWPTSAKWPGMGQSLFQAGTGDVLSVAVDAFSGRWVYSDIFGITDQQQRDKRRDVLKQVAATAKEVTHVEQNAHTAVYTQQLEHPRFKWAVRRLELWRHEPRARLTVRFHRTENELPEVLFVVCDLPCGDTLPETSNGGVPFVPYTDQLIGSCQDHFTIDDWIRYSTHQGRWFWVSRDAPLVTFGAHQVLARRQGPPEHPGRILAMVFNNTWVTNFVADSHGVLEFQFDMAWQSPSQADVDPDAIANTLLTELQIVINPKLRSDPVFLERLHRP
ncbi:MAG: hypothetical protein K9N55_15340 [Phycisphaerae bacterium]|nr:hypothetical protein [Phycisphaerae bacterium]